MKLGKAFATTAVSGILAALNGGCGAGDAQGGPKAPATDVSVPGDKSCCKSKNACKSQSGCKTETNASCAGG
jgi:hypothetical protein